ncbi:MAG: hypothetical protein EA395_08950 [Phormidium sp. GEM2.Bin31]|nr:hypothetical protein [Phormidium sp. BM_Day4_Bin.17]TVR10420.1 MAG: hypothetical protein EA395_08950 [Phormidium sp. GEM2.Bin31]UCJ12750.1 MAG: hypothetical protein JWS08_02755 [Phormidium sp. PBR-2020]
MKLIRAILGIFAYGGAAFFLLVAIVVLFDAEGTLLENVLAFLFCLGFTAGFAKLGQWLMQHPPLLGGNRQKSIKAKASTEAERLQKVFYEVVQSNQGSITVMQFAIASGLSGEAAKTYLDQQAKQFEATFHVSDNGTIYYQFPL